jgi:DNA recombination protein RmuC
MTQKVDTKLQNIQKDNSEQLEKMRQTVDEKLQNTLEKRLGESFKLVSDRLEQVHK